MNIAIVGSSGYIADFLLKRLYTEDFVNSILKIDQTDDADEKLDLQKPEQFDYESLNEVDYIIFTAAISGPDKCASDFELCWKINVVGTRYFIQKAIERECRILFFSSDAVFGDLPGQIYNELSDTKAQTPYGRMKKTIDDKFKNDDHFKALRLSYVMSAKDRFLSYCLSCIEKDIEANIFHPFYRNAVSASDVVNVVVWFAKHWDEYESFALNVAGTELVSRVRIADEVNRILGNKLKYRITSPGEDFYRNRPKITQMGSLYLYKYNIIEDNTFTEKMKAELNNLL